MQKDLSLEQFKTQVLADYKLAVLSRETSLLGRKEVLTGKAKFGIFGDGKELAQIAMAKTFKNGDYRSGYYRDQTWAFATENINIQQFFAQLYAHADVNHEPSSAGRQMNAHFATRQLDEKGNWKDQTKLKHAAADASPTASQMARVVGLGLASKFYRNAPDYKGKELFSNNGNEVAFATIGDASTSEGLFWEAINAIGVQKIPVAVCIWDDGYGISVPTKYQTTKGNIGEVLEGFRVNEAGEGFDIYEIKGWDYASLCEAFEKGVQKIRETHTPAIFHVREVTQPQGHSTSGSHERYKSVERLQWEKDYDCLVQMNKWLIENNLATQEEIDAIQKECKTEVRTQQKAAWTSFLNPIKEELTEFYTHCDALLAEASASKSKAQTIVNQLKADREPFRREIIVTGRKLINATRNDKTSARQNLKDWLEYQFYLNKERFNSHLYSQSAENALAVKEVKPTFDKNAKKVNGFELLNDFFDKTFNKHPNVVAFGEDVGHIGDVNQGFAGLQEKHGIEKIFDTGIREATIMGQALGLSMRGIRPIAEIQYLDYLIYGLQPLTDDVATLQYRTRGGQKAPLIIRTRGHRLEGIWHTGSPMGMILNSLHGMRVLVPRNMTQAAGFYNTLLASDEPGLVIECLNGYRLKETLPNNLGEYNVPLGIPETLIEGNDVTLVTYGSCVRIAETAVKQLADEGISVELIDAQSLLPFDINHLIVESLKKTNKIVFMDEDVPGGATAYMMQKVLEEQKGYLHLDSSPVTLSAKPHRSPYGSDGDYFSKPQVEDVFECIYNMMNEYNPSEFEAL